MKQFPNRAVLGPFHLNFATARLFRDGVDQELRPRAFRALRVLIQNSGQVVDYDTMIREAWDGVRVSKHTINVTIGEIKEVLKECGSWIDCRPRCGYCLEVPESEDLILTGWHFRNLFSRTGFDEALLCFGDAARNDHGDGRARQAIAGVYLMLGALLLGDPRRLHRLFLDAYREAEEVGGARPEMRLDHAFALSIFEGKHEEAEQEIRELQRAMPQFAEAYARLAMVCCFQGRLDEAVQCTQRARSADLLAPMLAFTETVVRIFRREFDLAAVHGRRAADLHPGSPFVRVVYAEALEHSGQTGKAGEQYRFASAMAADVPWIRAQAARFLARNGRLAEAIEVLEDLQRRQESRHVDAYHLALLLESLGRRTDALRELHRAQDERCHILALIDVDPKIDSLREDPLFVQFKQGLRERQARKKIG